MTQYLFTFRGRHSGRLYYATAPNAYLAAKEVRIAMKDLILERKEKIPVQPPLEAANVTET